MFSHKALPLVFILLPLLTACSKQLPEQNQPGATVAPGDTVTEVFLNADIVTVDEATPSATALAVRDGRILAVGSEDAVIAAAGKHSSIRDMGGRTIIPGLIDAHGHLSITAMWRTMADLQPPPAGSISSIAELQVSLRAWHEANPEAPWILGYGYDDSLLAENRHPDRHDLDAVSGDKPVLLVHVSGHLVACNTACLALAGIDAATEDPPGGHIRRVAGGGEPNGVLEETAAVSLLVAIPQPSLEQRLVALQAAQDYMASHGLTTVQDGALVRELMGPLHAAAEADMLFLDVVAYPVFRQGERIPENFSSSPGYDRHLRIGGIKLSLDGSPQGKTAWLTRPYLQPPHGQDANYRGYPIMEDESVLSLVQAAYARDIPVIAHANGDAAMDQLIAAVAAAREQLGPADRRTVIIHAQTAREDQIEQFEALGMVPSYFSAHTFYWGDWHRDSVFGEERASRISPLKTTVDRGMPFTTHNDTPVVPPDMMRLLWASVNRVTRSGEVLGPEHRISPLEALKSMTIHAAYQYFEEDRKGSISPGKQADLAVLSANPLKVAPLSIADIQVLETIKDGKTVFQRGNNAR